MTVLLSGRALSREQHNLNLGRGAVVDFQISALRTRFLRLEGDADLATRPGGQATSTRSRAPMKVSGGGNGGDRYRTPAVIGERHSLRTARGPHLLWRKDQWRARRKS